jgi:hypothetical protein
MGGWVDRWLGGPGAGWAGGLAGGRMGGHVAGWRAAEHGRPNAQCGWRRKAKAESAGTEPDAAELPGRSGSDVGRASAARECPSSGGPCSPWPGPGARLASPADLGVGWQACVGASTVPSEARSALGQGGARLPAVCPEPPVLQQFCAGLLLAVQDETGMGYMRFARSQGHRFSCGCWRGPRPGGAWKQACPGRA